MAVIIIWVLIFNLYNLILFCRELTILTYSYKKKQYVYWNKEHTLEHIEYTSIYILFIISLYVWLFWHWWIEHMYNVHLIDEYFFIVLFIFWIANNYLIKHISKEREENLTS